MTTNLSPPHFDNQSRDAQWAQRLNTVCRRIEQSAEPVSLAELASQVQVSPATLHRQFRAYLGVTPSAYGRTLQLCRLTDSLQTNTDVLDALYAAGFGSPARAYAATASYMGLSPGQLRATMELGWWLCLSELGWMLMAASERGICWLSFGDDPTTLWQELQQAFPNATLVPDETRLAAWLDAAREQTLLPKRALTLPLDIQGTAFQASVWRALRDIPLGETRGYGELASALGKPGAARAVGSACGNNRIGVIIPCHRVVRSDGSLSGYRWGVERKATLLARECAVLR